MSSNHLYVFYNLASIVTTLALLMEIFLNLYQFESFITSTEMHTVFTGKSVKL